eukprot:COSAG02_NODE_4167_length_5679_cov_8.313799_2_plen_31_part_00
MYMQIMNMNVPVCMLRGGDQHAADARSMHS